MVKPLGMLLLGATVICKEVAEDNCEIFSVPKVFVLLASAAHAGFTPVDVPVICTFSADVGSTSENFKFSSVGAALTNSTCVILKLACGCH